MQTKITYNNILTLIYIIVCFSLLKGSDKFLSLILSIVDRMFRNICLRIHFNHLNVREKILQMFFIYVSTENYLNE